MKENFVTGGLKTPELDNVKANKLIRHRESKNAISKLKDVEIRSQTTNGRLKNQANRNRAKTKLTATKRSNQEERSAGRNRGRDRGAIPLKNHRLDTSTRAKTEAREIHGTRQRSLQVKQQSIHVAPVKPPSRALQEANHASRRGNECRL